MLETAVRARIREKVPVLEDRIGPEPLPQAPVLPAVTYMRLSPGASHDLEGPDLLKGPRIRVNVWDRTYAGVKAVAEAVKGALDGFQGVAGGQVLQGVFLAAEQDLYEDDTKLHRVLLEFYVFGEE
jgi:hypothetical protein